MNTISLERVSEVLRLDREAGKLYWRETTSIRARGEAGYISGSGYRIVMLDGKNFRAHRLVWLLEHGAMPSGEIDHINGDRVDNRPSNLRVATRAQNNQNQSRAHAGSKSPYLGVTWDAQAGQWRAQITVDKRLKYLGLHRTAELARSAYVAAKRQLHTHGDRGWA